MGGNKFQWNVRRRRTRRPCERLATQLPTDIRGGSRWTPKTLWMALPWIARILPSAQYRSGFPQRHPNLAGKLSSNSAIWRPPDREVCIRTIRPERELTVRFARRIVWGSSARDEFTRGDLCALLEMQKLWTDPISVAVNPLRQKNCPPAHRLPSPTRQRGLRARSQMAFQTFPLTPCIRSRSAAPILAPNSACRCA